MAEAATRWVDWTTVFASGVAALIGASFALIGVGWSHRVGRRRQLVDIGLRLGSEFRAAVEVGMFYSNRKYDYLLATLDAPPPDDYNHGKHVLREILSSLASHESTARDLRWQLGQANPEAELLELADVALSTLEAWIVQLRFTWSAGLDAEEEPDHTQVFTPQRERPEWTIQLDMKAAAEAFDEAVKRLNR